METRKSLFSERNLLVIFGLLSIFAIVTFNKELGMIYMLMLFLSYFLYSSDSKVTILTEGNKSSWFYSLLLALAAYTLFVMVSGLFIGVMFPNYIVQGENTFAMVVRTMSATTPILDGNLIMTVIGWGILAALVETDFFFGKLLEWGSDFFGVDVGFNVKSWKAWVLIIMLSFGFAIFHIQAKGITNNQALMLTFFFAILSCWLVYKTKETKAAIIFHILSNTIAVMSTAGVIG